MIYGCVGKFPNVWYIAYIGKYGTLIFIPFPLDSLLCCFTALNMFANQFMNMSHFESQFRANSSNFGL